LSGGYFFCLAQGQDGLCGLFVASVAGIFSVWTVRNDKVEVFSGYQTHYLLADELLGQRFLLRAVIKVTDETFGAESFQSGEEFRGTVGVRLSAKTNDGPVGVRMRKYCSAGP
jgi:hypothetical protein